MKVLKVMAPVFFGAGFILLCGVLQGRLQAREGDTCIDCHSKPEFEFTNKKLFRYYQDWNLSVHKKAQVSCYDCHGGHPHLSDKEAAHGTDVGKSSQGAISYSGVAKTCSKCHLEIFEKYRQSEHYKSVLAKDATHTGPNCITCHGSINVAALKAAVVKEACARCHHAAMGKGADIPDKAMELLNKLLTSERYFRFIQVRGDLTENQSLVRDINAHMKKLSYQWHTFDLKMIEQGTTQLYDIVKKKKLELQSKNKTKESE